MGTGASTAGRATSSGTTRQGSADGTAHPTNPSTTPTPTVVVSHRPSDASLAARLTTRLVDARLHVAAPTPRPVPGVTVAAFVAVVSPAYEKHKKAKQEWTQAVRAGVPITVALSGPLGYTPKASWLRSFISANESAVIDFQNAEDLGVGMALLLLRVKPMVTVHAMDDGPKRSSAAAIAASLLAPISDGGFMNNSTVGPREPTPAEGMRTLRDLNLASGNTTAAGACEDSAEACEALRAVAAGALDTGEGGGLGDVMANDGVAVVVGVVEALADNVDVAVYGSLAMLHLVASSHDAVVAMEAADGVGTLCRVADKHATDAVIQRHCCLALYHMARHGSDVGSMGIATTTLAVNRHATDTDVLLAALQALHQAAATSVACNYHDAMTAVDDPAVRSAVEMVLHAHGHETQIGAMVGRFLEATGSPVR
eukprot:m.14253 g.14253  ORF g.14253 m.14253 type:complete len:427 (-) comp3135_c0_seq2:2460-3740(-)